MNLLDIQDLRTYFHTDEGVVKAVDDVSLQLEEGHTLGIVGESGSGKSVTSLSIMRLLAGSAKIETGRIAFLGQDLVGLPEREMRKIRGGNISMIFQEPMTSLNPVFTTGSQVVEAILLHQDVSPAEAREQTIALYDEVGIPNPQQRVDDYPHQMSGGQRQRVMIAMALSCNPKVLIADEPTTALDVTIQKQILEMIRELRDKRGMSVIFITHDLGVIAEIADDVAVMFGGKLVEYGDVVQIFSAPQHAYTKGLLACRPKLETTYRRLPTVSDFMEVDQSDGTPRLIEKQVDEATIKQFETRGRGRLLHPGSLPTAATGLETIAEENSDVVVLPDDSIPLLDVQDLKVHFPVRRGLLQRVVGKIKAVDGISFTVYQGQTLGLVGESGCGKTTTGRAILRLIEPTSGKVHYHGRDLASLSRRKLRTMRRQLQIIFQDPYGSLNPRMTVETALVEPMRLHAIGTSRADRVDRAVALLEEVDLDAAHLRRYPHEFSGGQRQRICIARALTTEPEFLVCDESVSALDVSVQAQVLNLLKDLQERRQLTYIFISHDLSVVKFMSDMMAVMNDGNIVEFGPSESIYANPQQAYTQKLIEATPNDDIDHIRQLKQQRLAALKERSE
ncbi:MAG: ABC transporter ATP-binding protein [Pirellulales bacterium]|jgi:peptide/nickel transport system ATP-binding protein|nr:ABC transporter ATP-binding protein [Pirellulales bacterium]